MERLTYEEEMLALTEKYGKRATELLLQHVEIEKVPLSENGRATEFGFVTIHIHTTSIDGVSYNIKNVRFKLIDFLCGALELAVVEYTDFDWKICLALASEFIAFMFGKLRSLYDETDCQIILALYYAKMGKYGISYPCDESELLHKLETDKNLGKLIYRVDGIPAVISSKSVKNLIDTHSVSVSNGKLTLNDTVYIDNHF